MRDLIIGACTNYNFDQVKTWINSINRCGFQGDKTLMIFDGNQELIDKVIEQGFTAINVPLDPNQSIYTQRFIAIYDYIYCNPARYVITTDVKDVVFQYDPIIWLEKNLKDKHMVFGSEYILYEDEPWGTENLYHTFGPFIHSRFKKNTVYNVGVLAGKGDYMRDLCLNIAINSFNRPIKICEQAVFNFMIDNQLYKDQAYFAKLEDKWTAHLATLATWDRIEFFKPLLIEPNTIGFDGKFITIDNEPACIAHMYNRTIWNDQIVDIYS
jgi:hypothetical protein